jgi:hypothetical protein
LFIALSSAGRICGLPVRTVTPAPARRCYAPGVAVRDRAGPARGERAGQRGGRARGYRTAGDDRIEARACAVKRLLHRWSHAPAVSLF